jgi:hypothetical protein
VVHFSRKARLKNSRKKLCSFYQIWKYSAVKVVMALG